MKKLQLILIALVLFFGFSRVNAQTDTLVVPDMPGWSLSSQDSAQNPTGVKCFDYYKFQSVQVSLGAAKDEYSPGETITFRGSIANDNDYPVVDGNVFVRVSKVNPNYTSEGQFIIDEIIPIKDINLEAKEVKSAEFNWLVPAAIDGGDYRADFFFSVGKKFNLGGLPFTNEIIIGYSDFFVKSENSKYISFDKSSTQVNLEKYNHIGSWPIIDAGQKVDISQPVKNTYNETKDVSVQYDLYFWDSLNEKDKISTKNETIKIPANNSVDLSYIIDQMDDSMLYLKITAIAGSDKSIINIRLASEQVHPRLNYPAITKFPINKGDAFTLFSCFHNTSNTISTNNKVVLSLYDKKDKLIEQKEYQGDIIGDMMAEKKDIIAQDSYDYIKLKAALIDDQNKTIDEYEAVYDCNAINKDKCFKAVISETSKDEGLGKNVTFLLWSVFLLIIVLVVIFLVKKRKVGILGMFAFFIVSSLTMLVIPDVALGYNQKSVTVNESVATITDPYLLIVTANGNDYEYEEPGDEWLGRRPFEFSLNAVHKMDMTAGNYTVKINDPINFSYNPELSYNLISIGWDTPYGDWRSTSSMLTLAKEMRNSVEVTGNTSSYLAITENAGSGSRPGYVMVVSEKPQFSMTSSNSSIISCSGMNCTAKGAGTATLTASIPSFAPHGLFGLWIDGNGGTWPGQWLYVSKTFEPALPAATLSWTVTVSLPDTATIQGMHVPMPFGSTWSPPIQAVSVLGGLFDIGNPYFITVDAGSTYSVSISQPSGYTVGYTLCVDAVDCHTTQSQTLSTTAAVTIPSGAGHYADLWWHYTPASYSCIGATPSRSNLCSSDSTGLTADTPKTLVSSCTWQTKCEYTCDSGYTLSGGTCIATTYSCTGTTPANSTLCTGDDAGLSADTAKSLASSCTWSTKCEYTCDSGYTLSGGVCVTLASLEEDCGLRMLDGTNLVAAACESAGSETSPLRIGKNGIPRGIVLVDITDSDATNFRIKTASDGIKAIKSFSSVLISVCGNGTIEAGEECDDGNTTSGDGCSSTCAAEAYVVCGDGTKAASEECDDGNTTSGDGCSATCTIESIVSHDSYSCYDDDVYWYDSASAREELKEECGTDGSCGAQYDYRCGGDAYSSDDAVWYSRVCKERGCSGDSCYENNVVKNYIADVCESSHHEYCSGAACVCIAGYSRAASGFPCLLD